MKKRMLGPSKQGPPRVLLKNLHQLLEVPEEEHPKSSEAVGAGLRIVGLPTLPASMRSSLIIDLINDPMLTPKTMKVLHEKMRSNYQIMRVSLLSST